MYFSNGRRTKYIPTCIEMLFILGTDHLVNVSPMSNLCDTLVVDAT